MYRNDVSKNNQISVVETAKIMGYSRQHVLRLINEGKIKAHKVGRAFVVDKETLGGIFSKPSNKDIEEVDKAVRRVIKEYKDVLRKLGKE